MKKLILIVFVSCSSILFGQKISELPPATTIQNEDLLPIVQGGVTKKITYSNLVAPIDVPAIDSAYVVGDSLLIITYFNKDDDSVYYARSIDNNWTRISGDSIFVTDGSITDTLILIAGATDLEGLSDVDLTTPDAFDILMLDDESMLWKNRSFSSLMAESPEGTWVRDTNNGYIYAATLTDKVGIGTDSPDYDFEVSNTAKIGDTLWLGSSYIRPSSKGLHINANSISTEGLRLDISGTNYYNFKTTRFVPASDLLTNLGDDGFRFGELWTTNIIDYGTGLYFNAPVVDDDTVFTSNSGVMGKMKAVKSLEDLTDVDLTTPDAFDILMLDDESMLWKNRSFSSLMAESPEGTWVRDTNNGFVFLANTGDFVGIGTTIPTLALEVYGGTLIRDQFLIRDTEDQDMIEIDATGDIHSNGTYISLKDSVGVEGPAYFDTAVNFGTHAKIIESATTFYDASESPFLTINNNSHYTEINISGTSGIAALWVAPAQNNYYSLVTSGAANLQGISRYGTDDNTYILYFDGDDERFDVRFPLWEESYMIEEHGVFEVTVSSGKTGGCSGQIVMKYMCDWSSGVFNVNDSICVSSIGNLKDSVFVASPHLDDTALVFSVYNNINGEGGVAMSFAVKSYNANNQVLDYGLTKVVTGDNYAHSYPGKQNLTIDNYCASWSKDTTTLSAITPTMDITTTTWKAIYLKGNAPYNYSYCSGITTPTDSVITFTTAGRYSITFNWSTSATPSNATVAIDKNDGTILTSQYIKIGSVLSNSISTIADISVNDYIELKYISRTSNQTLTTHTMNINIIRIQ